MSLLDMDSCTRYAASDGNSAISELTEFGRIPLGSIAHRTTRGPFGRPFLQIWDLYDNDSGVSVIGKMEIPVNNQSRLGVSFKYAIMAKDSSAPINEAAFNVIFSLDNILFIVFTFVASGTGTNVTKTAYTTSIFASTSSFEITTPPTLTIAQPATTTSTYNAATQSTSISSVEWTAMDFKIDFSINNRLFNVRSTSANGQYSVLSSVNNVNAIPRTITKIEFKTIDDNRQYALLLSDIVLYQIDGTGLTDFPINPRFTTIQRLTPNGNGVRNTWTPLSGTNFSNVNNTPSNTATYTTGSTLNGKQTFELSNLGSSSNDIKSSIQGIKLTSRSIDVGVNASRIRPIQTISNTDYTIGTNIAPSTGYPNVNSRIVTTHPTTSVGYTATNIDDLDIGFELVSP